jgi:hypothetical protein
MTPERAPAYQRVVRTVREIGPSSLLADEQQPLREAADHLIFTNDLDADVAARMALVASTAFVAPWSRAAAGSRAARCASPRTSRAAARRSPGCCRRPELA